MFAIYRDEYSSNNEAEKDQLFGRFMQAFGSHHNNFFEIRKLYYLENFNYRFCYMRPPKTVMLISLFHLMFCNFLLYSVINEKYILF